MIVKTLKATNRNGDSIIFGRHFRLIEGFDLSNLTAAVNYSSSTMDGATYQNSRLEVRDFDLAFFIYNDYQDKWWVEERRRELFKVFNPKQNPIRLDFETKGGESYYVNANAEGTPSLPQGFENDNRAWQKGLIQFTCDDPFIYSASETVEEVASWIPAFEFPLEIVEGGIEMGYRNPSLIKNVPNDGDNETGMIIEFKALASLSKPSLINVNTYETFKLNTDMIGGDVIRVNTMTGQKSVILIRNNVQTNIFNKVDLLSKFLQLAPGDNLFRYDAASGIDNLEVRMKFRDRFVGV